jgi:hypothetical protein
MTGGELQSQRKTTSIVGFLAYASSIAFVYGVWGQLPALGFGCVLTFFVWIGRKISQMNP